PLIHMLTPPPPRSPPFPYTTLFRSQQARSRDRPHQVERVEWRQPVQWRALDLHQLVDRHAFRVLRQRRERVQQLHAIEVRLAHRSEEHTSELQSRENLVCRLLLEKK